MTKELKDELVRLANHWQDMADEAERNLEQNAGATNRQRTIWDTKLAYMGLCADELLRTVEKEA